jgi:hypothetical protein
MHRAIDTYDRIAIAEIALYSFFLIGAVFLSIKHGFARSNGWRFLIILALARLIGSALRLASISDATDTSLYAGWLVTNSVGLGPLILVLLGLLGRVFDSINRQGHVVVKPLYQRLIELLMLIAMIVLIVGGTQSTYAMDSDGQIHVEYNTLSHVGMGLMIAVLALVILETVLVFRNQGYVAQGEHRILFVVVTALPFVAVRLIYSCILIFSGKPSTPWVYLGASVIMEVVVVLICEAVGFTLEKAPPKPQAESGSHEMMPRKYGNY